MPFHTNFLDGYAPEVFECSAVVVFDTCGLKIMISMYLLPNAFSQAREFGLTLCCDKTAQFEASFLCG